MKKNKKYIRKNARSRGVSDATQIFRKNGSAQYIRGSRARVRATTFLPVAFSVAVKARRGIRIYVLRKRGKKVIFRKRGLAMWQRADACNNLRVRHTHTRVCAYDAIARRSDTRIALRRKVRRKERKFLLRATRIWGERSFTRIDRPSSPPKVSGCVGLWRTSTGPVKPGQSDDDSTARKLVRCLDACVVHTRHPRPRELPFVCILWFQCQSLSETPRDQ